MFGFNESGQQDEGILRKCIRFLQSSSVQFSEIQMVEIYGDNIFDCASVDKSDVV